MGTEAPGLNVEVQGGIEPGTFFLEMKEYYKDLWVSGGIIGWARPRRSKGLRGWDGRQEPHLGWQLPRRKAEPSVSGTVRWCLTRKNSIFLLYSDEVDTFPGEVALIPLGLGQDRVKFVACFYR